MEVVSSVGHRTGDPAGGRKQDAKVHLRKNLNDQTKPRMNISMPRNTHHDRKKGLRGRPGRLQDNCKGPARFHRREYLTPAHYTFWMAARSRQAWWVVSGLVLGPHKQALFDNLTHGHMERFLEDKGLALGEEPWRYTYPLEPAVVVNTALAGG